MILTRLRLSTSKKQTLKALANPNIFHGVIERSQEGERERLLWRIDSLRGHQYLLILSQKPLNLQKLSDEFCQKPEDAESRDYNVLLSRVKDGTMWRFKLTANPTYSLAPEEQGGRGKVVTPLKNEEKMQWLEKKADKHGFSLQQDSFGITASRWLSIRKGTQKARVTLQEVTYEGILTVTNADEFRKMLVNGLGRAKAYGMGMMTLVSCHG